MLEKKNAKQQVICCAVQEYSAIENALSQSGEIVEDGLGLLGDKYRTYLRVGVFSFGQKLIKGNYFLLSNLKEKRRNIDGKK